MTVFNDSDYCNYYSQRHMNLKVKEFMNLVFSDPYSKKEKFLKEKHYVSSPFNGKIQLT